ncbi:TPA: transketolase [Candidatus Daviesbacteria bacterium]|nr:MAG: transketolase [Candidatus Daviesbacteria bacterium RIFCSPHIGHO2_02_FULL_39_41]OGE45607.1 MAG: transketolase [Candidatus Daviesbacteria bacterium RIFCSPHIGHO2_12_FULL_38_25]OGE68333.1 MAG: transketolase [Candidatus Daviesbacteria bacterium RIFCSPLOWO2_02_FULL_38_18]OGE73174.1 MAG: transketolase [Candidatus Daviesbacteria bacterium RIFCSPLOWO2_12_FULL_38_10]HBQ50847.1 transketolase [Candidatus Daviesbacteria bacterium]
MINSNANLNPKLFDKDIEQVPSRNGYGEGLVAAGEENPNVVALCADLTESTRTQAFKDKFPERFIEMGVAEQNLATVASGMAAAGKVPFITSYAMFSPGRNWEQTRTTICYNDQPVKIIGSHAGISVGPDGATHQALEDMAITRVLPNMVVICPCDAIEAKKATLAIAKTKEPSYIRLSREKVPVITTENTPFEIGKAEVFNDGKDVAIIACGQMVYRSLLAAKKLEESKISVRVINCHTIKPLDNTTILKAAEDCGAIVTAEEHQVNGGLGSAVAELVSQHFPVPMKIIGVEDRFGESGEPNELLEKFGLTKDAIIKAVTSVLRMKEK